MPAKPITLGQMYFAKREDANEYFKGMLYKYQVGDRVAAEDALMLHALLQNHPRAAEKIGCGIESFSVRSADFGTQCFWVNRSDGSTEKFSISGSIRGK